MTLTPHSCDRLQLLSSMVSCISINLKRKKLLHQLYRLLMVYISIKKINKISSSDNDIKWLKLFISKLFSAMSASFASNKHRKQLVHFTILNKITKTSIWNIKLLKVIIRTNNIKKLKIKIRSCFFSNLNNLASFLYEYKLHVHSNRYSPLITITIVCEVCINFFFVFVG